MTNIRMRHVFIMGTCASERRAVHGLEADGRSESPGGASVSGYWRWVGLFLFNQYRQDDSCWFESRRRGRVMYRRFGKLFVLAVSVLLFQAGNGLAVDSKPSRSQNQIDVTIVHVDKYGVYGPKLVFYWDTGMSKQKIDALMKTAEQLRNKKATVTYSASGELSKDKRPLLIDIAAFKEEQRTTTKEEKLAAKEEKLPVKEERRPAANKEGTRLGSAETVAADEPLDVNASEEKPPVQVPPPVKVKKVERAAPVGENHAPEPQKTALYGGEQRQPVYSEQKPTQSSAQPSALTKEEITLFIQRILRLNESKDLNSVMLCYADQINYYDRGMVGKEYIRKDMGYYFRNWAIISSSLDGDLVLIVTDQQDMRIAKFVSRYSVQNSKKSVTGRVENLWKIQKIGNELKIVDQKQRILNSETR